MTSTSRWLSGNAASSSSNESSLSGSGAPLRGPQATRPLPLCAVRYGAVCDSCPRVPYKCVTHFLQHVFGLYPASYLRREEAVQLRAEHFYQGCRCDGMPPVGALSSAGLRLCGRRPGQSAWTPLRRSFIRLAHLASFPVSFRVLDRKGCSILCCYIAASPLIDCGRFGLEFSRSRSISLLNRQRDSLLASRVSHQ
jgi:hypothetical protein